MKKLTLFFILFSCSTPRFDTVLDVYFDAGYGQVEIGGKYVGVEFHRSRPLPSRISYYYPVANSIDLSTDYWERYQSLPLTILLTLEGKTDTIGTTPYPYKYTPFSVQFENIERNYRINFSYDVCEDLPLLVLKLSLMNVTNRSKTISLQTLLQVSLRTSHTFAVRDEASVQYKNHGAIATAAFDYADTDSALVFIANAGENPVQKIVHSAQNVADPKLAFAFNKRLDAGESIEIIQLIGMCRQKESEHIIRQSIQQWQKSALKNRERILKYAFLQTHFAVADQDLQQTVFWSKAVLASNMHYIDGHFMPMPCPAEYNFFFTHDLLLTSLGAVNFDLDYVKHGFQFLHALTKEDSILAHAYYWKDTQFVAEYCHADNWNNMWIIIVASSYLKHSADNETVEQLFPILRKSLRMMLESKGEDDLMYSRRPDWWDVGNVVGAKVYNSALMVKVLQDYIYIARSLNKQDEPLSEYLQLVARMKKQFAARFWDDNANFLMNMLDEKRYDPHYYSGSLLAAHYDVLDNDKKSRLLKTAENILLDENIGIRNAMPPDFHDMISAYQFNGMEAGAPYYYFNGAVWPQGNVWYALGLISNDQLDEAQSIVKKYLTLNGIKNSPNGQPSFYEYRITDPESPRYGEIDKPTFLWAGGWYLYTLYRLAGLRENSWNIYFSPGFPRDFENCEYDLTLFGRLCRIRWRGKGNYFRNIKIDGRIHYSAVLTSPAKNIVFERGKPETPYLAEANCQINNVKFDPLSNKFSTVFSGIIGQTTDIVVLSPTRVHKCELNGSEIVDIHDELESGGLFKNTIKIEMTKKTNVLVLYFDIFVCERVACWLLME